MNEIISTTMISIFGVSGVSIIGVIITLVTLLTRLKKYISENSNKEEIAAQNAKSEEIIKRIDESNRLTMLLLDNITKIQGYSDAKKRKGSDHDE